jgi:hypothetical protein
MDNIRRAIAVERWKGSEGILLSCHKKGANIMKNKIVGWDDGKLYKISPRFVRQDRDGIRRLSRNNFI